MTTLWGELFEIVHVAYIAVIGPLFAVAFFGSVLYLVANRKRSSLAARVIRGIRPRKHRALRDHPAICAACGYPRGEGDTCPECGASLTGPGAVLFREVIESRRLPVPRWLTLAALMLALTLGAWMLSPLALLVGNKIEWRAWRVTEAHDSAEYTVRAAPGSPAYEVQLNTSYVVNEDMNKYSGPLAGHVYVILNDPVTNDVGWLKVDAIDHTWQSEYFQGGIQAAGFRPTSANAGVCIESGIAQIYRATGFDRFWKHSQAELADLQRLGELALSPEFRNIGVVSSLSDTPGALVWSANMVPHRSAQAYLFAFPPPVSNTAGILGIVMLVLPFVVLGIFGLWKLHRR